MDILSEVLHGLRLSGAIFFRTHCTVPWGVEIPRPSELLGFTRPDAPPGSRLVLFHVVEQGRGWVSIPGVAPQALEAGDLVLISADVPHVMNDDPSTPPVPAEEVLPREAPTDAPPVLRLGGDGELLRFVCGFLTLEDPGVHPLLNALPPLLHLSTAQSPAAQWLRASVDYTINTANSPSPGAGSLLTRLPELLFIESIRAYMERLPADAGGWLAGLRDPVVAATLERLHQHPERQWSLQTLAREVGVSRSVLTERFTELVGEPPMTYLTRWRMQQARELLRDPRRTIAEISEEVGYLSEASFSRAFVRHTGLRPGQFRKSR